MNQFPRSLLVSLVLFSACSSEQSSNEETADKEIPAKDSGRTEPTKPAKTVVDAGTLQTLDIAVDARNPDVATSAPASEDAATSLEPMSDKPAASGPSNIRALPKKWSDKQVKKYMVGITKGLGVACAYCHVKGDNASDKNKHKLEARKMIEMTRSLDRKYMGGQGLITCKTCHKGKAKL